MSAITLWRVSQGTVATLVSMPDIAPDNDGFIRTVEVFPAKGTA